MNEFNTIKEAAPNAAAVLFQFSLVLQERAKIKAPNGSLATATDLLLEPSIKKGIAEGVPPSEPEANTPEPLDPTNHPD